MTYGPVKEAHASATTTVTTGGPVRVVGAMLACAGATGTFAIRNTSATGAILMKWTVPADDVVHVPYPGMGLLVSVASQMVLTVPTSGFMNIIYT